MVRNLNDLQFFAAIVVQYRDYRLEPVCLGFPKLRADRRLATLEQRLGVPLLDRRIRRIKLYFDLGQEEVGIDATTHIIQERTPGLETSSTRTREPARNANITIGRRAATQGKPVMSEALPDRTSAKMSDPLPFRGPGPAPSCV
jgi:hypothetical protein